MKIAAITDDGNTISQHFGRAAYYLVVTVENGQIIDREFREKLGHAHFVNQPHPEEAPGQPHGMDAASHNKHLQHGRSDCRLRSPALPWHGHGRLRKHEGARHPADRHRYRLH